MSREPALRCYNCHRPALPGDARCRVCSFPLDWGAISDLRSLDYLKLRLEQWRRLGEIDDALADRLVGEVEGTHTALLASLAPRPSGPPPFAPAVIASTTPAPPPKPRGLRPRYRIAPQQSPRPAAPTTQQPPLPAPPPF